MRALRNAERTGLISALALALCCGLLSVSGLIHKVAAESATASPPTTIGGAPLTVGQFECITDVTPRQASFDQFGGSGSIRVTAPADCIWQARPGAIDTWITIASTPGGGSRTVSYSVAPNSGGPARTGRINIGTWTVLIDQSAADTCIFSADPAQITCLARGLQADPLTIQLTINSPRGCRWTVTTPSPWISLDPETARGEGRSSVHFSIVGNTTGHPRSGTIDIRDESLMVRGTVPVYQLGPYPPCVQAISPEARSIDGEFRGGDRFITLTIQVTAPPDCAWDAIPSALWLSSAGKTGLGSDTIYYNVVENPGGVRTGTVDVGGKIHTVTQYVGRCPVELICQLAPLQCEGATAPQARTFRDQVLARTERGQRYTQLYYKFSSEAVGIMMLHPSLILRSREMMDRYMPVIRAMISGERVSLTGADIQEIDSFLNTFSSDASPEFHETLKGLREDLRDPIVHSEFKLTVVEGPIREISNAAPVHQRQDSKAMLLLIGLGGAFLARLAGRKRRRLFTLFLSALLLGAGPSLLPTASLASASFPSMRGRARADLVKSGTALTEQYSTYFGGNGNEEGNSIAVDTAGNVYITGFTDSPNFPLTNAAQPNFGGGRQDAFVIKLDPSGSRVIYSTYIGGNGQDNGTSIAVDADGNAYITGFTNSTNFPTRNGLQPVNKGGFNAFVVKLDPSGSIMNSTLLGGSTNDYGSSIAVDAAGNVFVAGIATSSDFPVTNSIQRTAGGLADAFITKLDPSATRLVYSTYLGGRGIDAATGVAVDSSGNACVTGLTSSADFRTVNGLQPSHRGGLFDAFVAKINPAGDQLVYSTYFGGAGEDRALRIGVDGSGNVYIAGDSDSTDLPLASAAQSSRRGAADAFVSKISSTGNQLIYSTYLGGGGIDGATGIAVDAAGVAYVSGFTSSGDFPVSNAFQPGLSGAFDGFVARLSPSGSSIDSATYLGGTGIDSTFAIAADRSGGAYLMGVTNSNDLPVARAIQPVNRGGTADLFVSKLVFGPSLSRAEIHGKHLYVLGGGFDDGAKILMNGEPQKTRNDASDPTGTLIGKKLARKIASGQAITLRVQNSNGTASNELRFTRP